MRSHWANSNWMSDRKWAQMCVLADKKREIRDAFVLWKSEIMTKMQNSKTIY